MVGVQASREIVSADYLPSYEAYAINSQLLEDSTSAIDITIGDLCAANIGDSAIYGTPESTYVIIESTMIIQSGSSETKYKLRKL